LSITPTPTPSSEVSPYFASNLLLYNSLILFLNRKISHLDCHFSHLNCQYFSIWLSTYRGVKGTVVKYRKPLILLVPETGLEPVRSFGTRDFKSENSLLS
jgi:hypothetical protein